MRLSILCCFFFQGFLPGVMAQTVQSYTVDDGLSQGFVTSLYQDKTGFIWAGTLNGLSRFDGIRFKIYQHHSDDPTSISSNKVYKIIADAKDNLWVITDTGIQLYDASTDRFYTPETDRGSLSLNLKNINFDRTNKVWYCTSDSVFCFQVESNMNRPVFKMMPDYPVFLPKNIYGRLINLYKTDTALLLCTSKGLITVPDGDKQPKRLDIPAIGEIWQVWEDTLFHHLWIQSERGLGIWRDRQFHAMEVWENHSLVVTRGCYLDGKIFLNDVNDVFSWNGVDFQKMTLPFSEKIMSMCSDLSGNLWLGTDSHGIRKIRFTPPDFKTLIKDEYATLRMVVDKKDNYWYFRNQKIENGVRCGKFELINRNSQAKTFFPETCRWMDWDQKGNLWIVFCDGRLGYKDAITRKITNIDIRSLSPDDGLYTLQCSPDGKIILFTSKQDLIAFDPATHEEIYISLQKYKFGERYPNLVSEWKVDSHGKIWVAMLSGALGIQLDWKQHTGTAIYAERNGRTSDALPDVDVSGICTDEFNPDIVWLGTSTGLYRWELKQNRVALITAKYVRNDDVIFCLINAPSGNLWLGTQQGLIEYNPVSGNSRLFTRHDGLPASEFNRATALRLGSGTLLMGTVNGMISFFPDSIKNTATPHKMAITNVSLGDSLIHPLGAGWQLPDFRHDQNYLHISFALLNFRNSQTHVYRYRINGGAWVNIYNETQVLLAGLEPGKYRFEVEGSDSKSDWSAPANLSFTILQPWWRTWWALLLFFLIILVPIVAFTIGRFRMQRLKYRIVNDQHQVALEIFKTRLLANITHDLRTPLTVILGLSAELKQLLQGQTKTMAASVYRSGEELMLLVDQMLDLTRLREGGDLPLYPDTGDLDLFVKSQTESFYYTARQKGVEIIIVTPGVPVWMMFDEKAMKAILVNLISNAVKFTPAGGRVTITLCSPVDGRVQLIIADTGIGIAQKDRQNIFDRFFQVNPGKTYSGSGIGLSHTAAIVKVMQGVIQVESEEGKGSVFTVDMPFQASGIPYKTPDIVAAAGTDTDTTGQTGEISADKPVLLLVEDNMEVAGYIRYCLFEKYHILEARNGIEGGELAFTHIPDIIVSDVMMPGKTGTELCALWKSDIRTSHIPVVLLTARVEQADINRGLFSGADAYLTKPFDREELLLRLDNLLKYRRRVQHYFAGEMNNEGINLENKELHLPVTDVPEKDRLFVKQFYGKLLEMYADSDYGVKELERDLAMSKTQLLRKITALTGESPGRLLAVYRLTQAKAMLDAGKDLNVAEIAYHCGFSSPNYFSTAFRQEFGISPKLYKERNMDKRGITGTSIDY